MISFLAMMFMLSLLFLMMKHPLSCGMMLLLQTIMIALMTGLLNYNYWYSYILYLIMIGGMLILFIYMTSIASNEKFKYSSNLMFTIMMTLIMILILNLLDSFYMNQLFFLSDMMNQNYLFNSNFSMTKYFSLMNNKIMMIMILYLFITLIAIVKISNFSFGPLRQKF